MTDDAFFTIHSDLPREGPGDRESLDWALSHVDLPEDARILDAGCGPGADIPGLLDASPRGHVIAMDLHAPFVGQVARMWEGDDRVTAVVGDMAQHSGGLDLIWSAGSLYFLGVTEGLQAWAPALRDGGAVAFTEIAWRSEPSPEASRFWQAYPAMTDTDGVLGRVALAGYRVIAHRFLPDSAWQAYYGPLQDRLDQLRDDPAFTEAVQAEQAELDLWRDHGNEYGYLQVVAIPQ